MPETLKNERSLFLKHLHAASRRIRGRRFLARISWGVLGIDLVLLGSLIGKAYGWPGSDSAPLIGFIAVIIFPVILWAIGLSIRLSWAAAWLDKKLGSQELLITAEQCARENRQDETAVWLYRRASQTLEEVHWQNVDEGNRKNYLVLGILFAVGVLIWGAGMIVESIPPEGIRLEDAVIGVVVDGKVMIGREGTPPAGVQASPLFQESAETFSTPSREKEAAETSPSEPSSQSLWEPDNASMERLDADSVEEPFQGPPSLQAGPAGAASAQEPVRLADSSASVRQAEWDALCERLAAKTPSRAVPAEYRRTVREFFQPDRQKASSCQ